MYGPTYTAPIYATINARAVRLGAVHSLFWHDISSALRVTCTRGLTAPTRTGAHPLEELHEGAQWEGLVGPFDLLDLLDEGRGVQVTPANTRSQASVEESKETGGLPRGIG